jgi:hypothetical protein
MVFPPQKKKIVTGVLNKWTIFVAKLCEISHFRQNGKRFRRFSWSSCLQKPITWGLSQLNDLKKGKITLIGNL